MTVTEILPGQLWLGSAPCKSDGGNFEALPALRAQDITHIVNCTPDFPFPTAQQLGSAPIEHRVPVTDEDHVPIEQHFDAAADFIALALRQRGKVYVHCETGKSRSATIVLAYRVKHGGDTLRAAWEDTKERRPYAMPKPAFVEKLLRTFPGAADGFSLRDYCVLYLLDHFGAFGLGRETIEAAFAGAAEEYGAAFASLQEQVERAFACA